jgi:hypothetical protein
MAFLKTAISSLALQRPMIYMVGEKGNGNLCMTQDAPASYTCTHKRDRRLYQAHDPNGCISDPWWVISMTRSDNLHFPYKSLKLLVTCESQLSITRPNYIRKRWMQVHCWGPTIEGPACQLGQISGKQMLRSLICFALIASCKHTHTHTQIAW